jgi:hypothetical protein
LIWAIPSVNRTNGYFVLAAVSGMLFVDIKNSKADKTTRGNTYIGSAIMGYHINLGDISLFLHSRYLYIYDKRVRFSAIGGEIGLSYKLW